MNSEQVHELMFWRALADDLAAVLDAYHERYMDHGPALEEQADAVLARYREARR